jgi:hypothetical protein
MCSHDWHPRAREGEVFLCSSPAPTPNKGRWRPFTSVEGGKRLARQCHASNFYGLSRLILGTLSVLYGSFLLELGGCKTKGLA